MSGALAPFSPVLLPGVRAGRGAQGFYPSRFEAAFGDSEVTTERISKALAQLVRSLVSYQSRYDEGRAQVAAANVNFPNFTAGENLGKQIFMSTPMAPNGAGCLVCHTGETMGSSGANSNGRDSFWDEDAGYGEVTGMPGDMGTFKTPSLRKRGRAGPLHAQRPLLDPA